MAACTTLALQCRPAIIPCLHSPVLRAATTGCATAAFCLVRPVSPVTLSRSPRLGSNNRRVAVAAAAENGDEASNSDAGNVIVVEDSESMERYIRGSGDKLVVVDVSTKTCGPCKLIYPKFVKMSIEYPEVIFLSINGDLNADTRALMRTWGVKSVPNFRFFRNGKLIHSHVGAREDELRAHFLTQFAQTLAL